ncbi:MAG: uracil-DNA glycosylase [Bacteroidales bacterium]|nr:uracil-DNA glycosylase [Bacteroidales bacterium]
METMDSRIEVLRADIQQCRKCSLYETRHHALVGNGAENARIMLIGEAPGAEEDQQGIVFIGKAGQMLDKILMACNFSRDKHLFITNIVRCRPPGNRPPKDEEIAACLPYLERQIELINPSILITLGATALRSLAGGTSRITRDRGKWQYYGTRLMMPTYHPAALLRNPGLKKETWEDFKEVIRKYREMADPGHPCNYV